MVGTKEIMCHIIFKTLRVCPFYDKLYLPQLFTVVYVISCHHYEGDWYGPYYTTLFPSNEGSLKDNYETYIVRILTHYVFPATVYHYYHFSLEFIYT